jgi:hypothetical protein
MLAMLEYLFYIIRKKDRNTTGSVEGTFIHSLIYYE